ncbi:MAG: DUF3786 domain-containing protein [Dissulfurimicrobium sp.]|uniref:DUF3786 domain-containing protein n=1 Tax=Dissulfurimicrobium sp. TaxID=2022436 RepID=UPI00404AD1F2
MKTVFDIIRLTPKTNCGKCGFATCMAFAVAVLNSGVSQNTCPNIEKTDDEDEEGCALATEPKNPETALIKELKSRLIGIDLTQRAGGLGAITIQKECETALKLLYLGREVIISAGGISDLSGQELDPRDQILLYNYVFSGGNSRLSLEWVGLESFANSISKVVTLRRYTEEKLAAVFEGDISGLEAAAHSIGAKPVASCYADLCLTIPVLPMVPLQIHFWDADREDGFEARVKVLFDKTALDFLDIESLVFASERTVETLIRRHHSARV